MSYVDGLYFDIYLIYFVLYSNLLTIHPKSNEFDTASFLTTHFIIKGFITFFLKSSHNRMQHTVPIVSNMIPKTKNT